MTKHIVGFSGGIDSQACARWVLNRYPKEHVILMNSDAGGNEHPVTTAFIQWYSENIHPVVTITPKVIDLWKRPETAAKHGLDQNDSLTFVQLIDIKRMPPTRKARYCTDILKLQPQLRWIKENVTDDYIRYAGVRRDESPARANTEFVSWDEAFDCELHCPIADWTKKMCFDYIEAHGEKYNELYKLGFGRVGCAPCFANSNKDDIRNWALRYPEVIEKIRAGEASTGVTFFPPLVPGLKTNTIDQVVAWSMTERGGKQTELVTTLPVLESCSSKYGLCE